MLNGHCVCAGDTDMKRPGFIPLRSYRVVGNDRAQRNALGGANNSNEEFLGKMMVS